MRLLDTYTGEFHDLHGPELVKYAILSHCWAKHPPELPELSYQEVLDIQTQVRAARAQNPDLPHDEILTRLPPKIRMCCQRAREDQIAFAWIDSCCIDKTSSAELTEAINSMFKWYSQASVCYAFLADVAPGDDPLHNHDSSSAIRSSFRESIWFKRCWTLQELIAPKTVLFFSTDWSMIGTKDDLAPTIEKITGIDTGILRYVQSPRNISVARRMYWASRRVATRGEDEAYSLMGVFDINMPVIYGEGSRNAFLRLQERILQSIPDQSIFAWDLDPSIPADAETTANARLLLAPSPASFSRSGCVVHKPFPLGGPQQLPVYSFTPHGIGFASPLLKLNLLYARRPFQTFDPPVESSNSQGLGHIGGHLPPLLQRLVELPSNISLLPLTCIEYHHRGIHCSHRLALVVKTTDPVAEADQIHLQGIKDRKPKVAHLELVAFTTAGDPNANPDYPPAPSATNQTPQRLSRLVQFEDSSASFQRSGLFEIMKTRDCYIPYHPSTPQSCPDYVPIIAHAMMSKSFSDSMYLVISPEALPLPTFFTSPPPSHRDHDGGNSLTSSEVEGVIEIPFYISPFASLHFIGRNAPLPGMRLFLISCTNDAGFWGSTPPASFPACLEAEVKANNTRMWWCRAVFTFILGVLGGTLPFYLILGHTSPLIAAYIVIGTGVVILISCIAYRYCQLLLRMLRLRLAPRLRLFYIIVVALWRSY